MNHLNTLLEKTSDWDKDERYMATNDLMNELIKGQSQLGPKMDELMERRICAAILKQLDDHSNEVQSVAVKCLSILLKKVKQAQIEEICNKLSSLIIDGKPELRDIYSIGLKTLINDVPEEMGNLVCRKLVEKLVIGINTVSNEDVKRECMEILSDLIRRFGHLVDLADVTDIILLQLQNGKSAIKKRAANCLGSISVVCSDSLLATIVQTVISKVEITKIKSAAINDTKCYIQTLAIISKTVGYRLGKLLPYLLPIFMSFCGDPDNEDMDQMDDMNDIRDNCLIGIEAFSLRLPRELSCFGVSSILDLAFTFMKYDPNYSYDDDEDNEMQHDEDYDQDQVEGDDDDSSWKVRKNAVKIIHSIIVSQPILSIDILVKCFQELTDRFKEREENVRVEVIFCINELLLKAFPITSWTKNPIITDNQSNSDIFRTFHDHIPKLVDVSLKQMSGNSVKTKSALLSILRFIAYTFKEKFRNYSENILSCIKTNLQDKNQQLKLDCLQFLQTVLDHSSSTILLENIADLLPYVITSVNAEWFKIIAEGLRVLNSMVLSISLVPEKSNTLVQNITNQIFSTLIPRLDANDIDIEIKENAMIAAGNLFVKFGNFLTEHTSSILISLKRKLDSDITRIHALRCLATITTGIHNQNELNSFFNESAVDIAILLRQQNRSIKVTTLQTIDSFLKVNGLKLSLINSSSLRSDVSGLLTDSDLQVCSLSLQVMISLLGIVPLSEQELQTEVYSRLLNLSTSPIIQGQTQILLVRLFQLLVKEENGVSFERLFTDLKSKSLSELQKQNKDIINAAKCIGGICLVCSENERVQAVSEFVSELKSSDHNKLLSLLSLGEVGKTVDLFHFPNINQEVLLCFDASTEQIQSAASLCLGHMAVGNLASYLPLILDSTSSHRQYLLLCSLKEVITDQIAETTSLHFHIDKILPFLLLYIDHEDEAYRSIVADSLGHLLGSYPQNVLLSLQDKFSESLIKNNTKSLWTIISTFKKTLSHNISSVVLSQLSVVIPPILPLLTNCDDLEVRKASLLCVHGILHHNFSIMQPYLEKLEPLLLESVLFKLERVVDLGPFKHKVDDGIPIRKSALLCVEELLTSSSLDKNHITLFLDLFVPNQLTQLLIDSKEEIKLHVHQIIIKLCQRFASIMTPHVDSIIESIEKGCTVKKKDGMQGPELERLNELAKSHLRLIVTLNDDNDLMFNHKWQLFYDRITKANSEMFVLIKQEKLSNI